MGEIRPALGALDSLKLTEMLVDPPRAPHAVLDLDSRRKKAMKIERLLRSGIHEGRFRLLEIGTGSGGIAQYFARHEALDCEVHAVDVCDQRLVKKGFHYQTVTGTRLPFPDGYFDVVLTNHVIEHVGDHEAQMNHLSEINRVLNAAGVAYLAVPNRWMLVEPHFKLAFLSWWPERWRTPYLRLWGKGKAYDCMPLQMGELEEMLTSAGFSFENECLAALRETVDIELKRTFSGWWISRVPDLLWRIVLPIFPTLIYRLKKQKNTHI